MTADITVWNSVNEIRTVAMVDAFYDSGAWPDDIDWICFVPKGRSEPMFCLSQMVNQFDTAQGSFFVYYHS